MLPGNSSAMSRSGSDCLKFGEPRVHFGLLIPIPDDRFVDCCYSVDVKTTSNFYRFVLLSSVRGFFLTDL